MRILPLALLVAVSSAGQTRFTTCQTTGPETGAVISRHLIGCSDAYPDNLMWHLDRSDSIDGTLDGKVMQRTTGRGAVIYVLDTGVMQAHDEFARDSGSNVIDGIYVIAPVKPSASCPDPALAPCSTSPGTQLIFGHGTGVASVAAGRHAGVAPNASIVSVMIQDEGPRWVEALQKVIEHAWKPTTSQFRTAIVNISGGLMASGVATFEPLMLKMISGVDASGEADPNGKRFLFVVAGGNASSDPRVSQCDANGKTNIYPATRASSIAGLVSVGGITRENTRWTDSCTATEVLAPAADMMVADITARDAYRWKPAIYSSGTSFATPYVSGMAARLLEGHPNATPEELEIMLKASPSRVDGVPVPVVVSGAKRRAMK